MKGLMIALCAAAVALFSQKAMDSALSAAGMFVNGVMPALFPMMVLSRLAPPGGWVSTAVFSFLSGSPASVQRVAGLWQSGRTRCGEWLLALTGVMSPMFFVGTIARWTKDSRSAWILLGMHWLSACVTAAVWRLMDRQEIAPGTEEAALGRPPGLAGAVGQAAVSMLSVLGAMMLFSVGWGVVQGVLEQWLPQWTARSARLMSVLWALMEVGGGAFAMVQAWEEPPFALLGAVCSFGGMSIWLQNWLFLPESIRPAKLLWMRMLHGAVCYALCRITCF